MAGKKQVSSDIRFSDVAHYVGLSLMKDPSTRSAKSSMRLNSIKQQEISQMSRTSSDSMLSGGASMEDMQRAEKIKTQIDWLKAEQRAEMEQLKRMEGYLSDSMQLEKKAHRRAEKHREIRDFHQKQASEADRKIHVLQEQLKAANKTKVMLDPMGRSTESFVSGIEADGSPSGSRGGASRGNASSTAGEQEQEKPTPARTGPKAKPKAVPEPEEDRQITENENVMLKDYFDAADTLDGSSQGGLTVWFRSHQEKEKGDTAPSHNISTISQGLSQAESSQQMSTSTKRSNARHGHSSSTSLLSLHRPPQLSEEEIAQNHELYREVIRRELVEKAGSCKEAFKKLDLNGSGHISLQEFADGIQRLGVNWQEITQMKRPRDLFKLFDLDKDSLITLPELFPMRENKEPERVSTPEFWSRWVKRNRDMEQSLRDPMWQPKDSDAELQLLFNNSQSHDEAGEQRKWMAATIRRLKNRGKSDARCREIVAGHLPKGTGPKDREDVQTFSAQEVKLCRKTYADQVNDPVRNIQKVVYHMREQRRVLHDFRQNLWSVTMEPVMRKQMEDERKANVSGLAGGLGFGGLKGDSNANKDAEASASAAAPQEPAKRSLKSIAQEAGMGEPDLELLNKDFTALADSKNEMLRKKGFVKLLQQLCPKRTIADSDSDHWWERIVKAMPKTSEEVRKDPLIDFERFALWYANSEVRV
eukprot:TRINITY_DN2174_c0_g2_i1.p1 TRINITY_DN2174_c0_g2~~TRINITY_DN2174_c0_g2_i1.p1  ORF type:complete len:702 (-),score=162.84 TRINITY_DN2174_c0_g2_i1:73-2178(-)